MRNVMLPCLDWYLRNVGTYLPVNTTSSPSRTYCFYSRCENCRRC